MNAGQFAAQINEVYSTLTTLKLCEKRVARPRFEPEPGPTYRRMTYTAAWLHAFSNNYFHFQLADESLIYFQVESWSPLKLSYGYLDCPFLPILTYEEFLISHDFDYDVVGEDFRAEYDNFTYDREPKAHVCPLRYDIDPRSYTKGRHPLAHLHIGQDNDIRFATQRILLPSSFLCLILRQLYPASWSAILLRSDIETFARCVRMNLPTVSGEYWNVEDEFEMFLT